MKKLVLALSLVVFLFGFVGCEKSPVETKVGSGGDVVLGEEENRTDFVARLTLKSSFKHDYLLLEDSGIKDLLTKHSVDNIEFYLSYPGAKNPELLRLYTLRAVNNAESILQDFLATGYFEDEYSFSEIVEIG